MSELKVYHHELRHNEYEEFYLKYEADKVIAELQKQVHDYAQGLYVIQARAEKEASHQKYKRCLAMAKVCFLRFVRYENYLQKLCASNATIEAYKFRMDMYDKWEKRWFKLAKKIKEGV